MATIRHITPKPRAPLPAPLTHEGANLRRSYGIAINPADYFADEAFAFPTAYQALMALRLMIASWHQLPAGSLPTDGRALFRLARWGTFAKFDRERHEIMKDWVLCSDGRYYHPYVAARVLMAWHGPRRKQQQQQSKVAAPPAAEDDYFDDTPF